jgi:hypothetical protein
MTTLSDALVAYRICAQAEGRSPRTIEWITSSVRYFSEFLGGDPELPNITQHDLRRFIIALQNCFKYRKHYNKSTQEKPVLTFDRDLLPRHTGLLRLPQPRGTHRYQSHGKGEATQGTQ